VALALVAAALFGATAPVLKPLTATTSPLILSGLLYLGAGGAALAFRGSSGAPVRRSDAKWLVGVVVCGGIVGPLALLIGLARTSATASSLLLNLETVFTTLFAIAFFGEHVGRRALSSLGLLIAGAALITFERGGATRSWLGPLAIVGACLAWGVDNNLTQKLSARDPIAVVRWKGLCAGTCALAIGLLVGGRWPTARGAVLALAAGALGYGVSLVLYVRALRELGAARTGMLFATAPFAGALLAILLLHEQPVPVLGVAAVLMAIGVGLLATESS
jgi:drug/metabolite transporter (DMT)-like permease